MELLMSSDLDFNPKEIFNNFVQVGIVVMDIERSIRNLSKIFGIEPFRVIDWPPMDREDIERFYYGEPSVFTARMAFAELGPIELELIQPLEGESIWADFLQTHGEGIHHIRFNVDEIEGVINYLSEHGVESAQHGSGLRPGTKWVNFNTQDIIGFTIEVMNAIPGTDGRTPKIVDGIVQI
jgi:methylmalonyl-CoA/ethylmalonyl-CoA epimerase